MSFFSRIFSDKRTKPQDVAQEPQAVVGAPTQEYMRLQEFTQRLNSLLLEDRFLGTAGQLEHLDVHRRALAAWRSIPHQTQLEWNALAEDVEPHRPPFDHKANISPESLCKRLSRLLYARKRTSSGTQGIRQFPSLLDRST